VYGFPYSYSIREFESSPNELEKTHEKGFPEIADTTPPRGYGASLRVLFFTLIIPLNNLKILIKGGEKNG
jgi:hypothetical protein